MEADNPTSTPNLGSIHVGVSRLRLGKVKYGNIRWIFVLHLAGSDLDPKIQGLKISEVSTPHPWALDKR